MQAFADTAHHWYQRGNALHLQGKLRDAATAYVQALRAAPHAPEIHFNLGVTRARQGRWAEATAAYQKALAIRPDYAEAHNNLGLLLHAAGRLPEAVSCFRQALLARPDYLDARYNLATTLQEQDSHLDEALAEHDRVVKRNPNSADAHNNRGNTLLALARPLEALASFRAALRLDPAHAEAGWNLAWTELLLGRFETGWLAYEWRFRQKGVPLRHLQQPLWDGSPFPGRTVLIHAEQGLGDTVQFARYLELVKDRGGTVVFECHPTLIPLFGSLRGVDQLVALGSPLPEVHLQAPLLSLPRILHTTLLTIPTGVPYLGVDPEHTQRWRRRIGDDGRRRVGLVWSGSAANKINRRRSLTLAHFAPLAEIPDVAWFSLQCGPQAAELAHASEKLNIVNLQTGRPDIVDTAAMLMNLDLLISTDTMVPHLAGALGRPVWMLLAAAPDWRWLLDRADSPWYPTMRLFRQPTPGEWTSVIQQVRRALADP